MALMLGRWAGCSAAGAPGGGTGVLGIGDLAWSAISIVYASELVRNQAYNTQHRAELES